MNPLDETNLEDRRYEIAENCFIEIDIALKSHNLAFGDDATYNELSLLHTTLAMLLSNHENKHNLSNVNIEEFSIPQSPFKTVDGEPTDKLYHLKKEDLIHFNMNMVMNSKQGYVELMKSGYFANISDELIIEKNSLFYQLGNIYDRVILLINNNYSKTILNIN